MSRREASVRMEENSWEVGVGVRSESVITSMNSFFLDGGRVCRRHVIGG